MCDVYNAATVRPGELRAVTPVARQRLLSRAVEKTEGAEVEQLEKLYALLAQCIYRHRNADNKTELIQVRLLPS